MTSKEMKDIIDIKNFDSSYNKWYIEILIVIILY